METLTEIPPWVGEAAALPIAFSQVREDAAQDLCIVDGLRDEARVIMVASGGCTAAALAACPRVSFLHIVDPNGAQLALSRLKLYLLQHATPAQRLALLGHGPMPFADRKEDLATLLEVLDLPENALGPLDFVAEVGPDHAGRYEQVFVQLRKELEPHAIELHALLELDDLREQASRIAHSTDLGRAFDHAFEEVMALPHLVRLFGSEATKNPVEAFAKHFADRTRHVLRTLPAARNPYLWQMLRGSFPANVFSPWISAPLLARLPELHWTKGFMSTALSHTASASYDFVHLSNILDWLTPMEARATLDCAWAALRPHGRIFIRQLNSSLDIPALGPQFEWDTAAAEKMHGKDRSFFYRRLHIGAKP